MEVVISASSRRRLGSSVFNVLDFGLRRDAGNGINQCFPMPYLKRVSRYVSVGVMG